MYKNLKRAYYYLDKREKILFMFAILLTFFSAVLESLSIGIIIPLSSIILNEPNELIQKLNIDNWELLLIILFFVSIIGGLFVRIYSLKLLNRFSWNLTTKLSHKLLKDVIEKPIDEIENYDSNDIKSSVVHKIYTLMLGFIVPVVRTFSAAIFATIILIILFLIDPWVLFFVSIAIAIPYVAVFFLIKHKIYLLGVKIAETEISLLKNLNELFFDIRGVRSRSHQDIFIDNHVKHELTLRSSQLTASYIRELPRFYIEAGILCSLGLLIYLSTIFSDIVISLPILAAYALGLQRALPHFQNIFASISTINTNQESVDAVFDKFENEYKENLIDTYITGKPNVNLKDIKYTINNNNIFNNFNLELKNNTFYFLTGPSGSGKSTLVDIIAGYKKVDNGISEVHVRDVNNAISFMSQKPYIYSLSLKENIVGNLNNFDQERYEYILDICDLKSLDAELSMNRQIIIGDGDRLISGGQMQRISLARTIYARSSIYVLDEPFSALDQKTAHNICKKIIGFVDDAIFICILHNEKIIEAFSEIPKINLSLKS